MSGQAAGNGVYGPYHRLESPTQTKQTAARQVATQEIWGTIAKWGYAPTVKAYIGPLPTGVRGVEFTTPVPPRPNSHPTFEEWPQGYPGVRDVGGDYVAIDADVHLNTQV